MEIIIKLFILACISFPCNFALSTGSSKKALQEKRIETLDSRYIAEWQADFDRKSIEFKVTVNTTGFVGFGLSLAGTMNGADIVIGGVFPNGTTYFGDYHGTGNERPSLDEVQNWELLENGIEVDGVTTLKFKRLFDTCDLDDDIEITNGTLKIIWAIGETDSISQHLSTNRGALAVNMLDPPLPSVDLSKFDVEEVVLNYTLNGEDTVYWCNIHKRVSNGTSQIVAFKPHLETPESLKHTHHFNMYWCKGENIGDEIEQYVGKDQDCHKGTYPPRTLCQNNLYAWSLGGRILVFPDTIGFPWGEDEVEYFLFEVHVDNPAYEKGITFETGVNIYHTKESRDEEAGMLSMGHVTDAALMIPPSTTNWTLVGHCSSACTEQGIPSTGINLFNINLHAHKSGRKMRLRHFRNGQELPWVGKDDTYDFDFQENRPLVDEIKVLPGDHLSLECTFDSNWKSPPGSIIGGPSTRDEMCNAFIFYYPRTNLEFCFSGYPEEKVLKSFGIDEYSTDYPSLDPIIIKPTELANTTFTQLLNGYNWTDLGKANLVQELQFGDHYDYCISGVGKRNEGKFMLDFIPVRNSWKNQQMTKYPDIDKEYEEYRDACSSANGKVQRNQESRLLFSFILLSSLTLYFSN